MTEVFKWMKGINKGDIEKVLIRSTLVETRGNGMKLEKYRFRRDSGKYWFGNRVVDLWNRLAREVVGCRFTGRRWPSGLDGHCGVGRMSTHGFEPHQCHFQTFRHSPSGLKSPTCHPDT